MGGPNRLPLVQCSLFGVRCTLSLNDDFGRGVRALCSCVRSRMDFGRCSRRREQVVRAGQDPTLGIGS